MITSFGSWHTDDDDDDDDGDGDGDGGGDVDVGYSPRDNVAKIVVMMMKTMMVLMIEFVCF